MSEGDWNIVSMPFVTDSTDSTSNCNITWPLWYTPSTTISYNNSLPYDIVELVQNVGYERVKQLLTEELENIKSQHKKEE